MVFSHACYHPDDDFTLVTRYAPEDILLHPSHLCERDPTKTFIVEITLLSGRTADQKEALYRDVRQRIGRLGLKPENSILYLVENAPVDWSFHPDGSLVRDAADDRGEGDR